jgi:hypothetical protein
MNPTLYQRPEHWRTRKPEPRWVPVTAAVLTILSLIGFVVSLAFLIP